MVRMGEIVMLVPCARSPQLLSVDHVMIVTLALGRRAQRQRVGARGRLSDTEGLQPQFAAGDLGQIFLFLLGVAMPQDCAHGVHLRVAGGAVASGGMDFFEDGAGGADAEPAAAVVLRDQRGKIPGLRERGYEFGRISALSVERAPVFPGKFIAESAHAPADIGEFFGLGAAFAHASVTSARPWLIATTSRSTSRARKLITLPSRQNSLRMVSPGNTGAENRHDIAVSRAGS